LRRTPNLEDQVSVLMYASDRVVQLYPQAPASHFVACNSRGYGGGILTRLHTVCKWLVLHKITRISGKN
jgi:hypothetical protein